MNHLINRNITYFQHIKRRFYYASISFYAGFVFIIHGIYPNLLENKGSNSIKKLYKIIHFIDKD
jgi:hypothetical protein